MNRKLENMLKEMKNSRRTQSVQVEDIKNKTALK